MFKLSWPRRASATTEKSNSLSGEAQVTFRADTAQIQRLVELGAISPEQAAIGIEAGGLLVKVPTRLVAEFQASHPQPANVVANTQPGKDDQQADTSEIENLARRINEAGLNSPARLLLSGGRPVSFISSQFLLMLQPMAQLGWGENQSERIGRYSRLLESRANLDNLLAQLDMMESKS